MSNLGTSIVTPTPSRIVEGLRDTGYDFNTAVADIVDNSIAAQATEVRITAAQTIFGDIRVSIADNGIGMDQDELIRAMTYGAPPRDSIHSLGKFGLGLKTASTSCCRRLKVLSRATGSSEVNCVVWDLDFLKNQTEWVIQHEEPLYDDTEELDDCAGGGAGTLVVWENCDRLLSARYSNPTTEAFKNAFNRSLVELRQHLAMVFQRFLDQEDQRAENISIFINGEQVEAWDPFCRDLDSEFHTAYGAHPYSVKYEDDKTADVTVSAFIVPPKEELPSVELQRRVMPSWKNEELKSFSEESLSGFYVYRENRLLHWGDWFGIPGVDFHHKLCRFELSFSAELDDLFQVDLKKSRIILDTTLKEELLQLANPIKKEGDKRYRGVERKAAKKAAKDVHADPTAALETAQREMIGHPMSKTSTGQVQVSNNFGITITSYQTEEDGPVISFVDSLTDGHLWAPAMIGEKSGVQVNVGHEFFKRFCGANKENPTAIMGIDCLFWAFAQAEAQAISATAQDNLEEFRFEASKYLRKLAKNNLPDVSVEDLDSGEEN